MNARMCGRDFYLQLIAGLHVAFFWFSPLSWSPAA